jgi:tetratricopeptide (TPR) repeat protein
MLLERQGRRDEALKAMEELIGRNPDHAGALNYVGYSWADANLHLELALEYIQRALALEPDNGYIRDSLGWVYYRLGRYPLARRELEKSLEVLGGDPFIQDHLGDVYRRLGLHEQAREQYRKAVEQFEEESDRVRVRAKLEPLDQEG